MSFSMTNHRFFLTNNFLPITIYNEFLPLSPMSSCICFYIFLLPICRIHTTLMMHDNDENRHRVGIPRNKTTIPIYIAEYVNHLDLT